MDRRRRDDLLSRQRVRPVTKITDEVLVATWYLFHPIDDPARLAEVLRAPTFSRDIKGLVIVASEGVNGTIAGDRQSVHRFVEQLKARIHADHLTPRFRWQSGFLCIDSRS